MEFWEKIKNLQAKRRRFVVCTVVESQGSTPRKAGSKLIVSEEGFWGTIGGGDLEFDVIERAKALLSEKKPKSFLKKYRLGKELKMACGGNVSIFFDVFLPKNQLVIFGAGHIGKSLAYLGKFLGFDVVLIDEREEVLKQVDIQGVIKIAKNYAKITDEIVFDRNTFIVAASHTHQYDLDIAKIFINKDFSYFGVIASKSKAAKIRKALSEQGLSIEKINQLDMPAGIPIECETPQEIALSVMAKIVDIANKS